MVNYFATSKLLRGLYHLNSWFVYVRVPIFLVLILGWRFGKSTSYMGYFVSIQITALHFTSSMYYS